jgi:hypothetical protein
VGIRSIRTLPNDDSVFVEEISLEYGAQHLRSSLMSKEQTYEGSYIAYVYMAKINLMDLTQAEPLAFVKGGLQQLVRDW